MGGGGSMNNLSSIMDNPNHPLHLTLDRQRSFSNRLIQLGCDKDQNRKSFLPQAIRLYNTSPLADR